MKARLDLKPRKLSQAECRQISRQAADSAFPAVMAAVLFVLYRYRHWHKDSCVKLYRDIIAFLSTPALLHGKSLDNEQVEKYIEDSLGIDFDDLRKAVKIE